MVREREREREDDRHFRLRKAALSAGRQRSSIRDRQRVRVAGFGNKEVIVESIVDQVRIVASIIDPTLYTLILRGTISTPAHLLSRPPDTGEKFEGDWPFRPLSRVTRFTGVRSRGRLGSVRSIIPSY